jgi:hypothetical protein
LSRLEQNLHNFYGCAGRHHPTRAAFQFNVDIFLIIRHRYDSICCHSLLLFSDAAGVSKGRSIGKASGACAVKFPG